MVAPASLQRADANTSTIASANRKSKVGPPKRPQSPLPWFLRPSPPSHHAGFQYKGGLRSHPHVPSEVPYPLTCDDDAIEQEILSAYFRNLRTEGAFTAVDHVPRRTLDLGCGHGHWVINAALEWQTTEFVGFDVSPIQADLSEIDPDAAARIHWIHGNFLDPWPFENNSFDHVRVCVIAAGVPENKWEFLVEEMCRVLTPGGRLEWFEEDIHFPRIPPRISATGQEDEYPSRSNTPDSISTTSSVDWKWGPTAKPSGVLEYDPRAGYDDEVIEALFYEMFRKSGINLNPTSLIPWKFTTYFDGATASVPRSRIPMPQADFTTAPDACPPNSDAHDTLARGRPHIKYVTKTTNVGNDRVLSDMERILHHKHAVDRVLASREAIWTWIMGMETWDNGTDKDTKYRLRHPVIAEARADLDYAFKVFASRLQMPGHFYDLIPSVEFTDDDLAHAFDDDGSVSSLNSASTNDDHSPYRIPPIPPTPLDAEASWLLANGSADLVSDSTMAASAPLESATLGDLPLPPHASTSNLSISNIPRAPIPLSAPAIRARTASVPDIRNGKGKQKAFAPPLPTFSASLSGPYPSPVSPESAGAERTIMIDGPDAEQTVPYASRVLKFMYGVKKH